MLRDTIQKLVGGPRAGRPARHFRFVDAACCEKLEDRLLLSLLGIGAEIEPPDVYFDANGALVYDSVGQNFDADAAPVAISLAAGARPIQVLEPRDFQLHIRVDNSGQLISGAIGDDLVVEGRIDVNRDGIMDYDGVLLTGEIAAFGFLDAGSATDQYDFRFTPTGGDLMGFFEGKDIGMDMTSLNSTFAGSFAEDFIGGCQGVLGVIEPLPMPTGSIAGRVFVDADNNGTDEAEEGIGGVTVTLAGTDVNGTAVSLATVTAPDGSYLFEALADGAYSLVETQPEAYLDGDDSVGGAGGIVGEDIISEIVLAAGQQADGYNFGEIPAGSLSGFAYEDFNDDAELDFGERAIEGVTVTLTGVDDRGNAVLATGQTDADGVYFFADLRPGTYAIAETQPATHTDGQDTLGTAGGTAGDDLFSDVQLGVGIDGMNYNFGERPLAGSQVAAGQTATIGFWQNKNGQSLLKSLNGGVNSTQLGNWLAATFPKIFGAEAGENNLSGKTNAEVAQFYRDVFKSKHKSKDSGPAKLDAQVMATTLATYVTSSTLAGATAANYGFLVTEYGVGVATFNIGDCGAAFGVADNTVMTVLDILLATNEQAVNGVLYNMDTLLRCLANEVFSAINESGDI
ncbi:MAG: hypothetical protein HQ546_03550 [Planctomycetes bacterium]|nr:hypothetical protein [Planctomycetota bacterium]